MPVNNSQRNPRGKARERRSAAGVAAPTTAASVLKLAATVPPPDTIPTDTLDSDGNVLMTANWPTGGVVSRQCHTLVTHGETARTLATIEIEELAGYVIEAQVLAFYWFDDLDYEVNSYHRRGTYTYQSGSVALVGAVQTIGTDVEDIVPLACTLDISGSTVRVRVTGLLASLIHWVGEVKVISVKVAEFAS